MHPCMYIRFRPRLQLLYLLGQLLGTLVASDGAHPQDCCSDLQIAAHSVYKLYQANTCLKLASKFRHHAQSALIKHEQCWPVKSDFTTADNYFVIIQFGDNTAAYYAQSCSPVFWPSEQAEKVCPLSVYPITTTTWYANKYLLYRPKTWLIA